MRLLSSEPSVWAELWEYLLFRYFNPRLPYFNNLSNRLEAWKVVVGIACVFIGIVAAGIAFVIQKRMLSALPRALKERGALSPETALCCSDLGLRMPLFVRMSLRRPTSALRRYVRYVGQQDLSYDDLVAGDRAKVKTKAFEPDFRSVPLYLSAERADECLRRFDTKGNDGKAIAILISVFVVLFFVVCRFLPDIMSLFDAMISVYS
jgi:hypothetical protein